MAIVQSRIFRIAVAAGVALSLWGWINPAGARMANKGSTTSDDKQFEDEYRDLITKLGRKHGLTWDELNKKVMSFHMEEACWPPRAKVISEALDVRDGTRNTLVFRGNRWVGRTKDETEAVVINNQGVVCAGALGGTDARNGTTIVLFSPDRIDFFVWSEKRGGFFRR